MSLTYKERSEITPHPIAKTLFTLMEDKQTNLCLSADVTKSQDLLDIAETLGHEICLLKTHIDILEDFHPDIIQELLYLAKKKNFLLFEDRKFADIGNTSALQYAGGIYKISDWAHIINAHILPGPGIIEALRHVGARKQKGLLLLAQMSSQGNFLTEAYTQNCVNLATVYSDFVMGFIASGQVSTDPRFIHLTPGVQCVEKGDTFGQQYQTPEEVILTRQSDIIIVGRGIYQSQNPLETAKKYRLLGWNSYQKRLHRQHIYV